MGSYIADSNPHGDLARRYLSALLRMDREEARGEIRRALEAGIPLKALYLDVLAATQHEIGRLWALGQVSVAQEHYCTAVSQVVMAALAERAFAAPRNGRTLLATCVEGNLHEFGLRMVADFFEMAGWKTVYLGAGLPDACLAEAVAASRASVVALSASLDLHLPAVRRAITALREDARTHCVHVLVGGIPFAADPDLWRRVGADGHARDAATAVALASQPLSSIAA